MPIDVTKMVVDTEKTHPGLGRLLAMSLITAVSQRCQLTVAATGTGKSAVQDSLKAAFADFLSPDELTIIGMAKMSAELTGFRSVMLFDDLARVRTDYVREDMIAGLCDLVYKHELNKTTGRVDMHLADFYGSVIINLQPTLMRTLVSQPVWDAHCQDKTLRYYHYYRPLEVKDYPDLPEIPIPDTMPEIGKIDPAIQADLQVTALSQWGRARAAESTKALLRGLGALEGVKVVGNKEARLLARVLRPLRSERWIIERPDFEGKKTYNYGLAYLITEWATYGAFTIDEFMGDFKMSASNAYALLDRYKRFWEPTGKAPKRFAPSSVAVSDKLQISMLDILADIGVSYKET